MINYLFSMKLLMRKNYVCFNKKVILALAILLNLVLLAFYKYTNLLINQFAGNDSILKLINIALPIGISFFTFTQIIYLIDSYRGRVSKFGLLDYSLFVTFFPYLVSGPIVYQQEVLPQFEVSEKKNLNYKNLSIGIFLFSIGLFKKAVIGDTLSEWANTGFDIADKLKLIEAWITSLSYTLQLYFDFSGYTDMALGSALMFNIELPINFNSPYKSLNIQDFWRRWHITLSRFLREYIYVPLGGSRVSDVRIIINIMITFLLCGLWHGAGWMFLFWGFFHGAGIVVFRMWRKLNINLPKIIAWCITFNFINIAWVFFRARNFHDALKVIDGMLGMNGVAVPAWLGDKLLFLRIYGVEFQPLLINIEGDRKALFAIIAFFAASVFFRNSNELARDFKSNLLSLVFAVILFCVSMLHLSNYSEFLYFRF